MQKRYFLSKDNIEKKRGENYAGELHYNERLIDPTLDNRTYELIQDNLKKINVYKINSVRPLHATDPLSE